MGWVVIYKTRKTVFDYIFKHRGESCELRRIAAVFFANFEVFGKVVKHYLKCLIYLLNGN